MHDSMAVPSVLPCAHDRGQMRMMHTVPIKFVNSLGHYRCLTLTPAGAPVKSKHMSFTNTMVGLWGVGGDTRSLEPKKSRVNTNRPLGAWLSAWASDCPWCRMWLCTHTSIVLDAESLDILEPGRIVGKHLSTNA